MLFKTHITTGMILGSAYGIGGFLLGNHNTSDCLAASGLFLLGAILPDIDSDSISLREVSSFVAAACSIFAVMFCVPYEAEPGVMLTSGMITYLFARFVFVRFLLSYTNHRGIFHSIPMALIFSCLPFLFSAGDVFSPSKMYLAGGIFLGFISHLLLDELASIDLKRRRMKKSFGSAFKFFVNNWWVNIATVGVLVVLLTIILTN